MKVLHVIPAVSPRYGGPSHAIGPMCQALMSAGVEVQLAATDADPNGRIKVPIGETTSYEGIPAIFFRRRWSESFQYSGGLASWLNGTVN